MQQFLVQKKVRQEALLFGLKQQAFYVCLGLFIVNVFFLIGGFSLVRFVGVVVVMGGAYAALLFMQNFDFNQSLPTTLPKVLVNR